MTKGQTDLLLRLYRASNQVALITKTNKWQAAYLVNCGMAEKYYSTSHLPCLVLTDKGWRMAELILSLPPSQGAL